VNVPGLPTEIRLAFPKSVPWFWATVVVVVASVVVVTSVVVVAVGCEVVEVGAVVVVEGGAVVVVVAAPSDNCELVEDPALAWFN
jgi:hypothetical protein